jgi:hypothetical protein
MADHFSGPRAIADPAADIADMFVFPSPERPGHLVLAMTVFPAATAGALFSDAIVYRFRARTVSAQGTAFAVGSEEYALSLAFKAPRDGESVQPATLTCAGHSIAFHTGTTAGSGTEGLRAYAGLRIDPFFIDLVGVQATEKMRKLAFRPVGQNTLEGQNVLAIVVEGSMEALFGKFIGPLVAVVGETVTAGPRPMRIERFGRPEIKNVVLSSKAFDTVNRDLEIRDLFNQEDAFRVGRDYAGAYRARLNANLAYFDALDDKTDWPAGPTGDHPLTDLLLADFLVVDVTKPFAEDSFFEIESALLKGIPARSCGGRSFNDDIVDTLLTLLVNGSNGPRISDGVAQATVPAGRVFPYLADPNPTPPDLRARLAASAGLAKSTAQ